MVEALSQVELTKLDEAFQALAPEGAAPAAEMALSPGAIETEFCTVWPKAEPILKIVAKYAGLIPGVGPSAATILNGLIKGGDALADAVCAKA